ncbi:MAG: molybdopterin-dependent oxidoreductase [Nitrospiria bacterium]
MSLKKDARQNNQYIRNKNVLRLERMNRRKFLRTTGSGLAASLLTGCDTSFLMKRFLALPPKDVPFITPTEEFYIVQYSGPQKVDVDTWSLEISGKVEKPLTLRFEDILKRPSLEKMVTLMCIDNEVAGEQIGNAVWKGISLKDLIEETVPHDSVLDVAMYGADDYSDSITLNRAMNYDVFLAYEMNGKPLTKEHGFPLRAIVPGLYGIKNVKWITKIELTDYDYKGYWQKKSWTDEGLIKVVSRIDDPGPYNTIKDQYVLRGIAFAGYPGVGMVEVSFDDAQTWQRAKLDPSPSPYSWVFWHYKWANPDTGTHRIYVRTTSRVGQTQTSFMARAFPEGTSGLHSVVTFVEE